MAGALAAALAAASCRGGGGSRPVPSTMVVTSPAFSPGGEIPERFSCEGDNVSPPLTWSGVPSRARALAVVVDDPEAPTGTFTQWVLVGLGPRRTGLAEGERPAGSITGVASSGAAEYVGPCPPDGQRHHYRFTVYALRRPAAPTVTSIRAAAIASGVLSAIFGRR